MIYQTDRIIQAARALGGTPSPGDAELTAPNFIDTSLLVRPITITPSGTIRSDSIFGISQHVAAGGAVNLVTVATLGKGLWELFVALSYWSDFQLTVTDQNNSQVYLSSPGAASSMELMTFQASARSYAQQGRWRFAIPEDGWLIRVRLDARAAGTNHALAGGLHAIRLD